MKLELRHGSTENFAGKLSLCIGMPVMIRNNDVAELFKVDDGHTSSIINSLPGLRWDSNNYSC